jgi:hypothetical protein
MGELERFDEWAAAARRHGPPQVNVTSKVVRTIQRVRPRPAVERPAMAIAATALVAASIALVSAWQSWQTVNDPLLHLFKPPSYLTMR